MIETKQYRISEMTKKVGVEAHVLRYWEEELGLPIRRNKQGHRYYTEEDVERFLQIRKLKEKGIQLKGIRSFLDLPAEEEGKENDPDRKAPIQSVVVKLPPADYGKADPATDPNKEEKAYRLQMLLKGLVKEAVTESNAEMAMDIKESIIKEMDYQFRMVAEEQEQQQKRYLKQQEEYFEKLDVMITERMENRKKKGTGFFRHVSKTSGQ